MSFGEVFVGSWSDRILTVSNGGNSTLTVQGINYPDGFSGDWSGAIPSASATNVTVVFAPEAATNYSGSLTVTSDATGGANTLSVSGTGVLWTNSVPPAQSIVAVTVNEDTSVTLTYAVTPGFGYHLESATQLAPANWTTVIGSATNPIGTKVSFTDHTPGLAQLYYRTSSP